MVPSREIGPCPESNRDMKELGRISQYDKNGIPLEAMLRWCAFFEYLKVTGESLALDVPQNLDHYSENWVTGTWSDTTIYRLQVFYLVSETKILRLVNAPQSNTSEQSDLVHSQPTIGKTLTSWKLRRCIHHLLTSDGSCPLASDADLTAWS